MTESEETTKSAPTYSEETTQNVPTYSKDTLLMSKMFTPIERDILKISLDENKNYTVNEVNEVITDFKGGI